MKNLYSIFAAVLLTVNVFSQTPQKISYQAVIRDASNKLITNKSVGMRVNILQGTVTGTSIYSETQTPIANTNGLVSVQIGSGAGFDAIDWSSGSYFLKTEIDPTGGSSYTIIGTSQLLSVPYALYAKTASNGFSGNYIDLKNKPNLSDTVKYLEKETDPIFNASVAKKIQSSDTVKWNAKSNFSGNYNDLSNKPNITISSSGDTLIIGAKKFVISGLKEISDEFLILKGLKSDNIMSLYKMQSDGSNISLIHSVGVFSSYSANWSKDKSKILYSSKLSTTTKLEIFLMNADGSSNTQITFDTPQYGNNAAIFRSNSKIWYANAQSTGWTEFTEINYDGTGKTKLTNFNAQSQSCDEVDVNKSLTKICYYKQTSSWAPDGRIYISNIDFSNESRLTNNTTWEGFPQFSPDGQKIVYTCDITGSGVNNIFLINVDGTGNTQLTNYTTSSNVGFKPRWSIDGKKIAYTVSDGLQYDIWMVQVKKILRIHQIIMSLLLIGSRNMN
jgi:hypothetical protein